MNDDITLSAETHQPKRDDQPWESISRADQYHGAKYPLLQFQLVHPNSKLPTRGSEGAAGLDLYAAEVMEPEDEYPHTIGYDTGVAVAIPSGYVGLIFPRSSIKNYGIRLCNSVAVIDSDYRGTIKAYFDRERRHLPRYVIGDRIGQLVVVPYLHLTPVQVDELPPTARGNGGFGSTGKA